MGFLLCVQHWALRSRFDAFLSYLLNKPHEYYTVVPPPTSSVRGPPQLKMDVERAGLAPSHDPVFQALVPWIPPNNSRSSNSKPRRALPSRDPTVASFDDDYFQFILYCNPDVPVPASFEDPLTAELRCIIHNTPAHDNKTFAPYMLFSAINMRYRRNNPDRSLGSQHWDWEQLAMDLDVLPADADAMTIRRWTQRVKVSFLRVSYIMLLPRANYLTRPGRRKLAWTLSCMQSARRDVPIHTPLPYRDQTVRRKGPSKNGQACTRGRTSFTKHFTRIISSEFLKTAR